MYTCHRDVTYSEVSSNGHVDAAQIVRYFQDCSTMQSEALGVGMDFLEEHQHVWLLTAWQINFKAYPKLSDSVTVGTWAYNFDAMYGYRNFILKDEQDQELAVANSIWVLVDTRTGRPSRVTKEYAQSYAQEPAYAMEYAGRRIPLPEGFTDMEPVKVCRADLDTNNHVNNARYISMALEYVEANDCIRELRVEYKKAAVYGDMLYPRIHREEKRMVVALCDRGGAVYVTVELQFE